MKKYVKLLGFCLTIIIFIFETSCSAERRLAHLLKENPQLLKTDTVWKRDTAITKAVQADTVFKLDTLALKDTITIEKERLKVQIYYKDRKVYLKGDCLADTDYIKVPEITKKFTVPAPEKQKHTLWEFG